MRTTDPSPTPTATRVPLMARTRRTSAIDPLRFLSDRAGQPRFYYRTRGLTVAAAGISTEVRASGPKRFEVVRDETRRITKGLGIEREPGVPTENGPVWFGGAAFEPELDTPKDEDFPAARFLLPTEQLRIQADGTYLTLVTPVGDASSRAPATQPEPSPE